MAVDAYDILVVGAGPAGASAAAEAARRNRRVLLVERRAAVGVPVQCAEYIPAPLIGELEVDKQYIVQAITGLNTYLNNRLIQETRTNGFIIRRDVLDRLLADKARQKGARLLLNTKAIARDGKRVLLKTRGRQQAFSITARVVIGADGPRSTVARWLGTRPPDRIAAAQVRVPLVAGLDTAEVYFEPEIFGGYAWLFPRGAEASVGLGLKKRGDACPPLRILLDRFLRQRRNEGRIGEKVSQRISGWIPASPVDRIVYENILLAGDAAGQTHPITGAGIFPAVICGRMAGKWAARAAAANDLALLNRYRCEYAELFGETMQRARERRCFMEANWDRLDEIFKSCWVVFKEFYAVT